MTAMDREAGRGAPEILACFTHGGEIKAVSTA
jgi:hypothetical protein